MVLTSVCTVAYVCSSISLGTVTVPTCSGSINLGYMTGAQRVKVAPLRLHTMQHADAATLEAART